MFRFSFPLSSCILLLHAFSLSFLLFTIPISPVRSTKITFTQPTHKQLSAGMQRDAIIDSTVANSFRDTTPSLFCVQSKCSNPMSGFWKLHLVN